MKFASFTTPSGDATWGIVVNEQVKDLGPSGANIASSLKLAIQENLLNHGLGSLETPSYQENSVELLPVIPDPTKIICIGVNYVSHQEETGRTEQKAPTIFTRFADSQIAHGKNAIKPEVTELFDYEGELAVIIGKEAYKVSAQDAWDHVEGYSVYCDFTARDWQRAASQWIPGKNFVGTGAFGPYLVTTDEVPNLDEQILETRVNGEVRQRASIGDMYFKIPELIEYVSTFTPLKPGDVIVSGTPGGVGVFMDPPGLLDEGDIVEVEIGSVGLLSNTVALERSEALVK